MIIDIDSSKSIESLQRSFNSIFPFLKIEFFTKPHEKGKPTAGKYLVNPKRVLGEFSGSEISTTVSVDENLTVYELERMFEESYGLHVQVFRKSGRIWLETTATDEWTLGSQNEQGRELSEGSHEKGEMPDYHEQE
jgi:hypothetical protein